VETRLDTTQGADGNNNNEVTGGLKHKPNQQTLIQSLAHKNQVILVSNVTTTSNTKTYLAHKDQEVEMGARSRKGPLFIQKEAAHRPGIR
jgi:hypothetical protein